MNISGDIRFMQWNCCGIKCKLPQLQSIAREVDVICIQESLLSPRTNFWLKDFNIIRNDIVSPNQRGICTLIRDNLTFTSVDLSLFNHPSWEIQGICFSLTEGSLLVVNTHISAP